MFSGNIFTNKMCSLVLGCYHVSNCLLAWINQQNYIHKPFSVLVAGRFSFVNRKESLIKLSGSPVFAKNYSYVHVPNQVLRIL